MGFLCLITQDIKETYMLFKKKKKLQWPNFKLLWNISELQWPPWLNGVKLSLRITKVHAGQNHGSQGSGTSGGFTWGIPPLRAGINWKQGDLRCCVCVCGAVTLRSNAELIDQIYKDRLIQAVSHRDGVHYNTDLLQQPGTPPILTPPDRLWQTQVLKLGSAVAPGL